LVNPYDTDELADAIDQALKMPLAERKERWRSNWSAIEGASALGWGRSFLAALLRAAACVAERRQEHEAEALPVARMRSSPNLRSEAGNVRLI
jgi:trehalose-6-phosphate synthase